MAGAGSSIPFVVQYDIHRLRSAAAGEQYRCSSILVGIGPFARNASARDLDVTRVQPASVALVRKESASTFPRFPQLIRITLICLTSRNHAIVMAPKVRMAKVCTN